MNIDWIIPCRYAEVHDNLATIVGAGIDTWWVPAFPAPIQVLIAVRLLAARDELGPDHEHTVRNIVRDTSGDTLSDLEQPFKLGLPAEVEAARADFLNGIEVVTVVQFEATEPGAYAFEHIVDASSKSVPLHVLLGRRRALRRRAPSRVAWSRAPAVRLAVARWRRELGRDAVARVDRRQGAGGGRARSPGK